MRQFVTPPGWPAPPAGYVPPIDWMPPPEWGPPPPGWQFWVDDGTGPPVAAIGGLVMWARVVMLAFVLDAAFGVAAALSHGLVAVQIGQTPPNFGALRTTLQANRITDDGVSGAIVLTGVGVLVWTYLAVRRVAATRPEALGYTPTFATFAWVVPVVSLVVPAKVMNQLWNGSRTDRDDRHGSPRVALWWAAYLTSNALFVACRFVHFDDTDLRTFEAYHVLVAAACAMSAVAAILGLRVVSGITARFVADASGTGAVTDAPHTPDIDAR